MIRVFSGQGGGAYGSIQAGMLAEYFARAGAEVPSGAFGVSVGGLNLSLLMRNVRGENELSLARVQDNARKLLDLWSGIRGNSDIYRDWPVKGLLTRSILSLLSMAGIAEEVGPIVKALLGKKNAVHDFSPLLELIHAHLRGHSWKNVAVGVTLLESGEYAEIDLREGLYAEAVLASASIPLKAEPVSIHPNWAVDGGLTNMTPLAGCFRLLGRMCNSEKLEPEELWIFRCTPVEQNYWTFQRGLVAHAKRTLEVLVNNIDYEDLQRAQLINDLVRLAKSSSDAKIATEILARYGNVKIYVIAPGLQQMAGAPSSGLDFNPGRIAAGIAVGREVMNEFMIDRERFELSKVLK